MYQKLDFGPDATAFVRLQLSMQSGLWPMLCDLPLEMGRVFGFFPPTASTRQLIHFAWPLNSRADIEAGNVDYEYRQLEKNFVLDFVTQASGRMGIFRGDTLPPGKPVPEGPRPLNIYRRHLRPNHHAENASGRTEIYHIVSGGMTREDVDQVVSNYVSRMPLMAALLSGSSDFEERLINKELDESVLQRFVAETQTIIVSAYDFDAKLIWTRV